MNQIKCERYIWDSNLGRQEMKDGCQRQSHWAMASPITEIVEQKPKPKLYE